jgi:hypothetical protein
MNLCLFGLTVVKKMLKFERNVQGWMDVYVVDQTLDEDEEGYQTEAGHIIGSVEEGYRFVFPFST